MREIIAVCRSEKRSRDRVARVLDRYFWRIGDRTWRGKATNACLDRVSRELRAQATRNTAVVIHEIRSAHESRVPIIRIGSRHAFSPEGIVPVASHPAAFNSHSSESMTAKSASAIVGISALFHDLGKATILFQNKLKRALDGEKGKAQGDAVRHELQSAAVWDVLFGDLSDDALPAALEALDPTRIDEACTEVAGKVAGLVAQPQSALELGFIRREGCLSHLIGMLILTHHKLPDGDTDLLQPLASRHVRPTEGFAAHDLAIAPGIPFWHEDWWRKRVAREARALVPNGPVPSPDIALRAALMLADHVGSSEKKISDITADHLANTKPDETDRKPRPADSLSAHVRRVYANSRYAADLFTRHANGFPGLDEGQVPTDIAFPMPSEDPRFAWQGEAARAARSLCEESEGGFFACLMAGTGTGKTRGAPTILAGAAFGDVRPERRYFRMSLGLGLRVLATQSAREYTSDLGFNDQDVSVLVGQVPLKFSSQKDAEEDPSAPQGSESLIDIPEWLQVEMATGGVPEEGATREADWLRALSLDTDRGLPAFCDRILEAAGPRKDAGKRLLKPAVMVGTIDHLMGVASPINSRFLIPSLRVTTSDLILDEIDQFDGEDIAAIGRLIYQTACAGRRVIIMSATLTSDIAKSLYIAYRRGWANYATVQGLCDHVNLLVTGDAPGSCFTNADGRNLAEIMAESASVTVEALKSAAPARRAEILEPCDTWPGLVEQVNASCSRLHDLNAVEIDGFRISAGLVRLTRIAHVAAMAAQLRTGDVDGRFRVTLCLHSQFPRLHRGWIETRLKRALTRKGDDPNDGLRFLCHAEDLFERASDLGHREVEIVVLASPVIETGNDLDFDWAILDPISTRSIIQSAGRVQRHRAAAGDHPNILILGRSPIAMQEGNLSRPGVETKLPDETLVPTPSLEEYDGRYFRDLAGETDFAVIDARPVLSDGGVFPLRDAEARLRQAMIDASEDGAGMPLGRYVARLNARLTRAMSGVRRFRRSEARTILYKMAGEDFETATWRVDLAPGTRESCLRETEGRNLQVGYPPGEHLFDAMTERAWADLSSGAEVTPDVVSRLMQVEISDYKDDDIPETTYSDFTGFTRGCFDDLSEPFGKAVGKQ